jgi:5-methylcytosine-specific restriction protein A
MPQGLKHPCATSGCVNLAAGTYCDGCRVKRVSDSRPTSAQRGYGYRWQKTSRAFLMKNSICVDPDGRHLGRIVAAEHTDHIVPHKGSHRLFWDPSNWQPLCSSCHSHKTRREDAFGN